MKLYNIKAMIPAVALLFTASVTSCMSDLDDGNIDPNAQSQVDITALYSKCYACLILKATMEILISRRMTLVKRP